MLRVLGRLPWLGLCRELGRQASGKPRGRKPRGIRRGGAGHRKPCAPTESHGPSESLGKPPFRSRRRTGSGRIGAGVGKPRRPVLRSSGAAAAEGGCPARPAASLRPARWPARWPDASPARSLWVIISETWYNTQLYAANAESRSAARGECANGLLVDEVGAGRLVLGRSG